MNTTNNPFFRSKTYLICLISFVFSFTVSSQHYYFENYNVPVMSSSKVYCVLQHDSTDIIWMGTLAGVTSYNGSEFKHYTFEDGLAHKGVKSIFQDSRGIIWFGHLEGGFSYFDGNSFQSIDDTSRFRNNKDITSIFEDSDGSIWFTTWGNGTYNLKNPDSPKELFEFKNYKGGELSDIVYNGIITSDQKLYFVTDFGIRSYDRENEKFKIVKLPEGLGTYFAITCVFEDTKGAIWYGTHNGGLYKSEGDNLTIYDLKDGLETNFIWTIFEDSKNRIWLSCVDNRGVDGGVSCIDGDEITSYNKENGLNDNKISSITEDKEGNILMGTLESGFNIFKGNHFISFHANDGLSDNQIFAIHESGDNQIWIGTGNGITVFESGDENSSMHVKYYNDQNSRLNNQIRFVDEDNNGNIWIATESAGIFSYNKKKDEFSYNPRLNDYNILYGLRVTALEIDKNNHLWAGTNEGLAYFEIDTENSDRLSQRNGLAGNSITALYIDSENNLWVGSAGRGVSVLRNEENEFSIVSPLSDITPKTFTQDHEGNIWVGTEIGILVFDGDTIIKTYTRKNGLLSNLVNFLIRDNQNNIYVGSNQGLNKIVPGEETIYTYNEKNGFVGGEARDNAAILDYQGNLWFGTANGLIKYFPERDDRKVTQPLTHITKLRVNLEERKMKPGLKLKYKENSIIFDIISICLTNPDAVKYKVFLEGYDEDWQPASEITTVKYSALSPGRYTFKVIASNNYGIWNDEPVSYPFQIKPPFYLTWWFILIVVVILVSSIVILIKVREANLVKENRILEEKVEERTQELRKANENLEEAYKELESKNKDITDSIRYAQRIQFAILPPEIPFRDTFVFFRPKDIVSGDFYWIMEKDNLEFIAAVDCTGHGVPGAFMSFIGYSSLNKIVNEKQILKPSDILDQLNMEVTTAIHYNRDEIVQDGMDLALICYNKDTGILEFSGAYNPLYLVRNNELIEYKATRTPIGHSALMQKKSFINYEIQIEPGDCVYIFSDGFADQFGGDEGKKFRSKPFKSLLVEMSSKPIAEQSKIIEQTISEWMGNKYFQIDDMLVVGRKFPE